MNKDLWSLEKSLKQLDDSVTGQKLM